MCLTGSSPAKAIVKLGQVAQAPRRSQLWGQSVVKSGLEPESNELLRLLKPIEVVDHMGRI